MKIGSFAICLLLFSAPGWSQTLTLTATHLTMEQGGQVPPLVWTQNAYPKTCTGYPVVRTTATPHSAVGTYAISLSAGTFTCTGYAVTFVGNNLEIIPSDGNGAQINNDVAYPPGFASGPSPNPVFNVTSNSTCRMVGDGVTDNTVCLNRLFATFSRGNCRTFPSHSLYLYFPPGIYLTTGQLNPCGISWMLFGSGPQRSILRLAPNSAAFNTGIDTEWFNPTSINGNDNFNEYIYNMGFDIGYGNPNAIPFTTAQNNVGAERNVIIWSEDGNCPYAVSLSRGYPGPALFKNVALYGCVNAVNSNQIEYSWTFDQITTEGQLGTVINSGPLKIAIQHWLSDNSGTALAIGGNGGASVIDSELLNGAGSAVGITNAPGGSVFVRNVTATGYRLSEADAGTGRPITYDGKLTQNWTGTAQSLFNSSQPPTSLYLQERETPLPADDPTQSNWTELGRTLSNWCLQIIGSASVTVYAPPGQYTGSGSASCAIPDTVNHLEFYNATTPNFTFTFTVAGTSATPLVIDGCVNDACIVRHTGSRTVVLTDTPLKDYVSYEGAGDVFFENVAGSGINEATYTFRSSQSVWGRQFDLESRTASTDIVCSGCALWILGYKTETTSPAAQSVLVLQNNAKAEIFTAFLYPLGEAGSGTSSIIMSSSELFTAPVFSFVNVNGYNWQYWIQEQKELVTKTLASPSQNAGNYMLHMYYSFLSIPLTPQTGLRRVTH